MENELNSQTNKICIVVVADTLTKFLTQLDKAQAQAALLELRLDYLQNLKLKDLKLIADHIYKDAIVCLRTITEGGKFKGTFKEQQALLQHANDLGFKYLDIDLAIIDKIKIKNRHAKIIISYHDFYKTPSLQQLNTLSEQMKLYMPDILKFAVKSNSYYDTKCLMRFLINNSDKTPMIVLAMGEHGRLLRIISPFLGGYLTFASIDKQASAPGQLEFNELKSIYNSLNKQQRPDRNRPII